MNSQCDFRHCRYGTKINKHVVASVIDQGTKNIMSPIRDAQRYETRILNLFRESNWIRWPSVSFKKILLTLKK